MLKKASATESKYIQLCRSHNQCIPIYTANRRRLHDCVHALMMYCNLPLPWGSKLASYADALWPHHAIFPVSEGGILRDKAKECLSKRLRRNKSVPKSRYRLDYGSVILGERNRPPPIYQYPNMAPRLSGQTSIDGESRRREIRRSWVRFPPRSKDFFFASCGSLFPFTRANAQWVIHGFK